MSDNSKQEAMEHLESLQEAFDNINNDDNGQQEAEIVEELIVSVLSLEVTKMVKVNLGIGGPAIRLCFEYDNDGDLVRKVVEHCDFMERWQVLEITDELEAVLDQYSDYLDLATYME